MSDELHLRCLLLSERSAYIQNKKSLDWSFSPTPPSDINMKSLFSEKKASCIFDIYAVRANAQPSNFKRERG